MHKTNHWVKLISVLLVAFMLIPAIPVYAADSYTVTFLIPNDNGTATQHTVEVSAGSPIGNMPSDPELSDRVFIGWYYYDNGVKAEVTAETIPAGNMVVFANTRAKENYTVTFYIPDPDTGSATPLHVYVKEGNAIGADNIPEIPEISGKYIVGWFSAGKEVTADTIPTKDMNVTAKYGTYAEIGEINPIVNIPNGTALEDIELPETVVVTLNDVECFASIEWNLNNDDYDKSSKSETTFTVYGKLVNLPESVKLENNMVSVTVTVMAAEKAPDDDYDDNWYWQMLLLLQKTEYDVTAEAGEGGTITPVGVNKVKYGSKITFTITADEGYEIKSVKVNGNEQGAIGEYTFENVRSKQSISVTFGKVDQYESEKPIEWMNPFSDISESDDFYNAIRFVYEHNLFKGTSQTEFSPMTTMTRAMFVTVLGRLADIDTEDYTGETFTDVVVGEYYAPYVEWAVENSIVKGYGDGSFGVNDEVTIEQAVVIISRFANFNDIETSGADIDFDKFVDINDVSEWSLIEMLWALESGVYDVGNGILNPQGAAARSLVAEIIFNFCSIYDIAK